MLSPLSRGVLQHFRPGPQVTLRPLRQRSEYPRHHSDSPVVSVGDLLAKATAEAQKFGGYWRAHSPAPTRVQPPLQAMSMAQCMTDAAMPASQNQDGMGISFRPAQEQNCRVR